MTASEWLEGNGIDPDSVSDTLKRLIEACDDPAVAAVLRCGLAATEPCDAPE
jgi:hypothetical protein